MGPDSSIGGRGIGHGEDRRPFARVSSQDELDPHGRPLNRLGSQDGLGGYGHGPRKGSSDSAGSGSKPYGRNDSFGRRGSQDDPGSRKGSHDLGGLGHGADRRPLGRNGSRNELGPDGRDSSNPQGTRRGSNLVDRDGRGPYKTDSRD